MLFYLFGSYHVLDGAAHLPKHLEKLGSPSAFQHQTSLIDLVRHQ